MYDIGCHGTALSVRICALLMVNTICENRGAGKMKIIVNLYGQLVNDGVNLNAKPYLYIINRYG